MARLHILEQTNPHTYRVIVHATTPAGNNAAGFLWSDCLKNAGLAQSGMDVGTGPGQISNAENNQVTNGTVIEAGFVWQDDPSWDNPTRLADLNLRAQQAVDDTLSEYRFRLNQFGRTVA